MSDKKIQHAQPDINQFTFLFSKRRSQELCLATSRLTLLRQPLLSPQICVCISKMEIHLLQGRSQLLTSLFPGDTSGCKVAGIVPTKATWLQQSLVLGST